MTKSQRNIVCFIRRIAKELRLDGETNSYKLLYAAARDLEKYYKGETK